MTPVQLPEVPEWSGEFMTESEFRESARAYAMEAVMADRDRLNAAIRLLAADLQQSAIADGPLGLRAMCIDGRNRLLALLTPSEPNSDR